MAEETSQFSAVVFRSQYRELRFHTVEGENRQFENGVYLCDTPEKLAEMEGALKKMQPAARACIIRTDRETALATAMQHQQEQMKINAAIAGPFQADHNIARNPEAALMRMQRDATDANAQNTNGLAAGLASLLAAGVTSKAEKNSVEGDVDLGAVAQE